MADETPAKIQPTDVVWGAASIAREIGLDRQSTYHLLSRRLIPAQRIGRRWVASRARLRQTLTGEREGE